MYRLWNNIFKLKNPKAEGYAPPASLEKEDVICQRCFRLRNYNEFSLCHYRVMIF